MSKRISIVRAMLLLAAPVILGTASAAPGDQTLHLALGLGTWYDSNILEYSSDQIALFESGTAPYEFSVRSRDDLIWNPSVALTWNRDMGRGRARRVRARAEGDFHQKNGTADFRSAGVAWRERFRGDRRFTLSFYALPHYYLRQLYNADEPMAYRGLSRFRYRRADFGLQIGSAYWSQRIRRRTRIGVSYRIEHRDYNGDFDERDSNTHEGSVALRWTRLPRRGSFSLEGGYHLSNARGGTYLDPLADTIAAASDLSYHGMLGSAGGAMELARRGPWRFGLDLGYGLETRRFDSDAPSDRYHFGRRDILHTAEVGLRASLRPRWSARVSYRYETNHAELGGPAPSTTDSGSYRVHQIRMAIDWSREIWRRAAQPEAESDSDEEP